MTEPALEKFYKFPQLWLATHTPKLKGGQNNFRSKFFTYPLHILSSNIARQYIHPKCHNGSFLQGEKLKERPFQYVSLQFKCNIYIKY